MNSLEDNLDRFDRLWREGDQPSLAQFLEHASLSDEQRSVALLELIAIDMEYRWRTPTTPADSAETETAKIAASSAEDTATELRGSRPLIEDYVKQWPEILQGDQIPNELVAEEFRIRHRWGDRPAIEDYVVRFGNDTALREELEATHRELQHDEPDDEPPAPAVTPAFATLEASDSNDSTSHAIMFGRYRLIRQLGKGGMGEVYLAEDTQLERRIALKTPHLAQGEALKKRFVNEAKAAATLHHPGICPVFDAGEIGDQPFITMAYIDGDTLREHWEQSNNRSTLETVRIFADIAKAMQVAHDAGIVHRDLKPTNVMLNAGGQPVVMDFGLAFRESQAEGTRLTQTGDAFGSPAYMSPEQVENSAATVQSASDIYSLGVMLFEALTGRLPFTGTVSSILVQIARDAPPLPSQLRADIDRELEQLCLQMQEKDAAKRPASMSEVAERLDAITQRLQVETQSVSEGSGQSVRAFSLTRRVSMLIATALVPIVIILGLIVINIKTPYGPVRIEVAEEFADQINVRVLQGGELVEVADKSSGWSLSLEEGEYEFELGKGGEQFEIEPRRVTVSQENEAVVSVSFPATSIPETRVPNTPNDSSSTGQQAEFALSFDGKDDYVQLPFEYDGSHPLTAEGWVTPVTLNTNRMRQIIVADECFVLYEKPTGLQFGYYNDPGSKSALKKGRWWFAGGVNHPHMVLLYGPRVNLNDPVHFAVQVLPKTGDFQLFINGLSVDQEQRNLPFVASGRDFRIGRDYTSEYEPGKFIDEPFKGLIHAVRFSKRLHYNGKFKPPRHFEADDQTLALYRFDEGNGFTLKDSSGNGHDGEIHGAKWKEVTTPAQSEVLENEGYVDLFDGETLDGWEAEDGGQWSVENGVLTAKPDGTLPWLVYTKSEFTNARVRVECKIGEGGNSGVQLRRQPTARDAPASFGKGWGDGYEAQISNDPGNSSTGSIMRAPGARIKERIVDDDTWFTLELEAKDDLLTVWVNGNKTAETRDSQFKSGQIALQASPRAAVQFRKVQVKPLD